MKYSIGVDIGGSHVSCCMYEHSYINLVEDTFTTQKVDSKGCAADILDTWTSTILKTVSKSTCKVEGVGIAMPGPFDYFNGISKINDLDKLSALYEVNIREALAERLPFKASQIRFINDASAFSIGESVAGKGKNYSKAMAITLGTGLGASFLEDSYPVLEHSNVPPGGFLYNQKHEGVLADDVFSTRGLIAYYHNVSGYRVNNVRELYEKAKYDAKALECFHWFGNQLGKFLDRYVRNFGAEVLIIGGNISKAYDCFGECLQSQLPGLKIDVSEMGENAAIVGSALLLDDHYYKQIQPTLKLM